MFNIVLYQPKIPQNTGNIIRLVANNGCHLHLIQPMGFNLEEKNLCRSGLDYKDLALVTQHVNYMAFLKTMSGRRIWAITTKGRYYYHQVKYQAEDVLLFGSETSGLSEDLRQTIPEKCQLRIPMQPNNRSMNLANTVAIISYEAWRQQGFLGGT